MMQYWWYSTDVTSQLENMVLLYCQSYCVHCDATCHNCSAIRQAQDTSTLRSVMLLHMLQLSTQHYMSTGQRPVDAAIHTRTAQLHTCLQRKHVVVHAFEAVKKATADAAA
eukprot:932-Heterococcus_DN1.PRE.1